MTKLRLIFTTFLHLAIVLGVGLLNLDSQDIQRNDQARLSRIQAGETSNGAKHPVGEAICIAELAEDAERSEESLFQALVLGLVQLRVLIHLDIRPEFAWQTSFLPIQYLNSSDHGARAPPAV